MPAPTVFNPATGMWVHAAAVADPAGGATVDAEGRTAMNSILAVFRSNGVIAGATGLNVGHTWNAATNQAANGPAVADPTGGVTIDVQARAAIVSVLGVLRGFHYIAGATGGPSHVLDEDTGAWSTVAIANPTGGTADAELRTAVNAALAALRRRNLISQD